jgi:hypothetical protein
MRRAGCDRSTLRQSASASNSISTCGLLAPSTYELSVGRGFVSRRRLPPPGVGRLRRTWKSSTCRSHRRCASGWTGRSTPFCGWGDCVLLGSKPIVHFSPYELSAHYCAADGRCRSIADLADRSLGRRNWAGSAPTLVASGTARIGRKPDLGRHAGTLTCPSEAEVPAFKPWSLSTEERTTQPGHGPSRSARAVRPPPNGVRVPARRSPVCLRRRTQIEHFESASPPMSRHEADMQ